MPQPRVAVDAVGLAILKDLGSNDAITGRKIFERSRFPAPWNVDSA